MPNNTNNTIPNNSNIKPDNEDKPDSLSDRDSSKNTEPENHLSFNLKKSPTVVVYQRSYETFSLNKKMSTFSTDDFIIHDTITLN